MRGNGGEHVIGSNAEFLSFHHELFDFLAEQLRALGIPGFGQSGDDSADSGLWFKQAGGDESSDDFVGGVGVDFQFTAKHTDGGKGIAGAYLAGYDRFLRGVNDLLIDGNAGPEVDAEGDHGVYYNT